MGNEPAELARLIRTAVSRPLLESEIRPALEWLEKQEREEIGEYLAALAGLESERLEIERRKIEAREVQIELITKQIAPRLVWGLTVLIFGGVAALASKIGIPIAMLFEDYP